MTSTSSCMRLAYLATRTALSAGSRPRINFGSTAVTPVGQLPDPHFIAWMQPKLNMNPRAELTKSAPSHSAQATLSGVTNLPAAIILIRSCKPCDSRTSATIGSAWVIGNPT